VAALGYPASAQLASGTDVSERARVPALAAELERALALAAAELGRRERTMAQLRALLARRGIGEAAAVAALAELSRAGLVDDSRYARLFVEDRRRLDGWGAERIARELERRGVARELIEAQLAGAEGGRDAELRRALELLRARFPAASSDPRQRGRAFALLIRRGYDSELAADALAAHAPR
jgi:regulatory protein